MHPTPQPLTVANIGQAAALSLHGSEQLRARLLWLTHTPYARAFIAQDAQYVYGWIGCIHFGTSAWITDLILNPSTPDARIAYDLLGSATAAAEEQGCMTQYGYSSINMQAPWKDLGFAPAGNYVRCSAGRSLQATHDGVMAWQPEHTLSVLHLDRLATGEDRGHWLMEHQFLGQVYCERGRVRGFALALTPTSVVVADDPAIGLELQRWCLPLHNELVLPAENTLALEHLSEQGYERSAEMVRWVRGPVPAAHAAMVFGACVK